MPGFVNSFAPKPTIKNSFTNKYRKEFPMHLQKQIRSSRGLLLVSMLSILSACGTLNKERLTTNICPQPAPLSKNILQAMQPNSTEVLKRADDWSKNSQQLLDSVTPKS